MSEAKFTKGEWSCDYRDEQCAYINGPPRSYSECFFENAYDAHLIAAAPEMYAFIDRFSNADFHEAETMQHECKELLAKARGEQ